MSITDITSLSELNKLTSIPNKITVIDFYTTWCLRCRMIAPTFEALSKRYTSVNFCKVDVDAAREVYTHYKVRSMPTFVFLKGTSEVDRVQGADRSKLEITLAGLSSPSSSAFADTAQTLAGSSQPSTNSTGAAPRHTGEEPGLDPQLTVLLMLVLGCMAFWYIRKPVRC